MPYLANVHIVGCLPGSVEEFDSAQDAWEYLINLLGDDAWEPDDEDDPCGPHSLTQIALKMQDMSDRGQDGCVYSDLEVFEVERIN